jgi:hypothetical protein
MACSRRYRGEPVVIVMALSINCHRHEFIARFDLVDRPTESEPGMKQPSSGCGGLSRSLRYVPIQLAGRRACGDSCLREESWHGRGYRPSVPTESISKARVGTDSSKASTTSHRLGTSLRAESNTTPPTICMRMAMQPRDSFCLYGSEILSQVGDSPGHCTLGGLRHGGEVSPPYRHILVSVCWKTFRRSKTKDALNVLRGVFSSMTLGQCGQIWYLISQRGCSRTTALPI